MYTKSSQFQCHKCLRRSPTPLPSPSPSTRMSASSSLSSTSSSSHTIRSASTSMQRPRVTSSELLRKSFGAMRRSSQRWKRHSRNPVCGLWAGLEFDSAIGYKPLILKGFVGNSDGFTGKILVLFTLASYSRISDIESMALHPYNVGNRIPVNQTGKQEGY